MSFTTKPYLSLLRPQQWIKNLFVFAPLFFGGKLTDLPSISITVFTFILFCLAASGLYILNDYKDIAFDKLHPTKKLRPLASGEIEADNALLLSFFLLSISLILAYTISPLSTKIVFAYIVLNIGYSFGLKNIILLDIIILSSGFVLRVIAGGISANIEISYWLYLLTFLLALFIALGKRYDDLILMEKTGEAMRSVAKQYSKKFIQYTMIGMAGVILITYLMYVTSTSVYLRFQNYYLVYSSLFVAIGLVRYLQQALLLKNSASPTKLVYNDRVLQLSIIAWVANFIICIYWP